MAGDQTAAIEHGLGALERSGYRGLDQQPFDERIARLEQKQQRVALVPIAHPPDPGARGAEGRLDEKRKRPLACEFIRRANDIGSGLRYVQPRQQVGEASLALDLLERLEIGERDSEAGRKFLARGGKQVGLLMHRKQRVDIFGFDGFDHRSQIAVGIGARRGRPMHAADKAREAPEAQGIAGDEIDPVAGQAERGDGLAR